ncbi:hypothetical protein J6590_080924 [Homalodisca vitripennis]|nr:hypothetical protein J6590_080924 [Homalodisca vitripennis]
MTESINVLVRSCPCKQSACPTVGGGTEAVDPQRQTKENEGTSEYRAGLSTARQRVPIADCSLSQFLLILEHR